MVEEHSFRKLDVCTKPWRWFEEIYLHSRRFPPDERFALTAQLRRAAISVHRTSVKALAGRNGKPIFIIWTSRLDLRAR